MLNIFTSDQRTLSNDLLDGRNLSQSQSSQIWVFLKLLADGKKKKYIQLHHHHWAELNWKTIHDALLIVSTSDNFFRIFISRLMVKWKFKAVASKEIFSYYLSNFLMWRVWRRFFRAFFLFNIYRYIYICIHIHIFST